MNMMDTLAGINLSFTIAMSFGSMVLLDMIWVKYTHALIQHRALAAGAWAAGIAICMAVITINYVDNAWMIIPTMAGAFVGTYVATKWEGSRVASNVPPGTPDAVT
jgi:hypothetical protein